MGNWAAVPLLIVVCAGILSAQERTSQPVEPPCFRLICEKAEYESFGERAKSVPQIQFDKFSSITDNPRFPAQGIGLEELVLGEVPLLGPLALNLWRRHYSVREWYGRTEGVTLLDFAGGQFAIDLEKQRVFLPGGERRYLVTLRLNLNQLSPER